MGKEKRQRTEEETKRFQAGGGAVRSWNDHLAKRFSELVDL